MEDLDKIIILPPRLAAVRKKKTDTSIENNTLVRISKAKKKQNKHEEDKEDSYSDPYKSDSSEISASSDGNENHMADYFKRILGPMFEEQRRQNRQDMEDIINNYRDKIERSNRSEYSPQPQISRNLSFLEDHNEEVQNDINKSIDAKDHSGEFNSLNSSKEIVPHSPYRGLNRTRRLSSSQERKITGTPKIMSSSMELQRPIIVPNELNRQTSQSNILSDKIDKKSSSNMSLDQSVDDKSKSDKQSPFIPRNEFKENKDFSLKKTPSKEQTSSLLNIERKSSDIMKSESLFMKRKILVDEARGKDDKQNLEKDEEADSSTKKTDSGNFQNTTTASLLKPSDDKSNSQIKPVVEKAEKSDDVQSKKINLFGQKHAENSQDKKDEKPESSLFGDKKSKPTNLFGQNKPIDTLKTKSVFTEIDKSKSPLNLFSKKSDSQGDSKPQSSLFKNTSMSQIPEKKLFQPGSGRSVFGSKPQIVANSQDSQIAQNNSQSPIMQDEDVGMGNVTPPKLSQNRDQEPTGITSRYKFNRSETNPVEHSQGSGESKPNSIFGQKKSTLFQDPPKTGSIFQTQGSNKLGASNTIGQGPIFSMGTSTNKTGKISLTGASSIPKSQGLFSKGPSQGQPDFTKRTAWTTSPFGGGQSQDADEDDGLFSSRKQK